MRERTAGFQCLVGGLVMVVSMVLARGVIAGDHGDAAQIGSADRADATTSAPAAQGSDVQNLARLAELERLRGNGGPEDDKSAGFAGYDKDRGMILRDASSENLLNIRGFMQLRYTYFGRTKQGSTVNAGEVGGADDSFFEVERARLIAEGNVLSHNLTYKFMIDGDNDGSGTVKLLDAYVEYWAGEALGGADPSLLGLGFGQFKPHFMRQEATSIQAQQFVDRSLTDEFFNIDRNVGIWARGDIANIVYYDFAVTNGFDSVDVAPSAIDNIPAFIGKLDFNLWGGVKRGKYEESNLKHEDLFAIGVSAASDANNNSSGVATARFKVYQLGFDTDFKTGPLSLRAEYMARWLDYKQGNAAIPGGDGSTQFAEGFYVQGGFLFPDSNIELVGRASFVFCEGQQRGNGTEVGPGINWYISGNHKIKLQADVLYVNIDGNIQDSTEDMDGGSGQVGAGSTLSSFNSSGTGLQAGEEGVMVRCQLQLSF